MGPPESPCFDVLLVKQLVNLIHNCFVFKNSINSIYIASILPFECVASAELIVVNVFEQTVLLSLNSQVDLHEIA